MSRSLGNIVIVLISETKQFIRFHNGVDNINRPWIMKVSDVKHLTESEIRNLFSLPPGNPIPEVSYVNVPPGTKLYNGAANELYGFDGGGSQFYIDKAQFEDELIPSEWFNPSVDIEDFLN